MNKVAARPKLNTPKRSLTKQSQGASKEEASGADDATVAEVADYIAQITGEIAHMARSAKLDMLAYFLTMARMEAELMARHNRLKDEMADQNSDEWAAWREEARRR